MSTSQWSVFLGLMHIGPIVKLLLICKRKLAFYSSKQCLIFLYSIEWDYCQHESVNVGWTIVQFILKNIAFDNIVFEDVFVLRAADTKTPACWSVLSSNYCPCVVRDVSDRWSSAAVVIGTDSEDELLHLPRKNLLAGSFTASTACLRPRRSNRPSPTTLSSGEFELCRTWYGIRVVVHTAVHGCCVALCRRARMYVAHIIRGRLKWLRGS